MSQVDLFMSYVIVAAGDNRFGLIKSLQIGSILPVPDLSFFKAF